MKIFQRKDAKAQRRKDFLQSCCDYFGSIRREGVLKNSQGNCASLLFLPCAFASLRLCVK
jgi:hypothetical protein